MAGYGAPQPGGLPYGAPGGAPPQAQSVPYGQPGGTPAYGAPGAGQPASYVQPGVSFCLFTCLSKEDMS